MCAARMLANVFRMSRKNTRLPPRHWASCKYVVQRCPAYTLHGVLHFLKKKRKRREMNGGCVSIFNTFLLGHSILLVQRPYRPSSCGDAVKILRLPVVLHRRLAPSWLRFIIYQNSTVFAFVKSHCHWITHNNRNLLAFFSIGNRDIDS